MSKDESEERERDENRTTTERADASGRASTSRRTVLRGVAAGSVAGVGGFGGAQGQETTDDEETTEGGETTAQEDQRPEFFEQGAEVGVQLVADGPLTAPTDFAAPGGDDDRLFVTDQTGEVYVIGDDGVEDEPFADVSDRMVELGSFTGLYASQTQDYDERGLLGIEFHPDFAENNRFYLHYSAPPDETLTSIRWDHFEVVSEFEASDGGESADLDSERELLRIPKPQYNHNGGPMAFDPDGYLCVPMGDGGGANDEMYGHAPDWYDQNRGGNGQDLVANLLGDVIRIDVDETDGDQPYGIPDDNPFADDDSGALPEIYAYGFRNPFGISFDSQGRMFVADAGQDVYEEANVVENGGNYGWNVKEGTHCFSTESPSQNPEECPTSEPDDAPYTGQEFTDPIVEYPHVYQGEYEGIVIVGGYFYEQETVPNLNGKYVFGDWTKDPEREEPAGRLLAATDPGGEGEAATETTPGETTTAAGDEQVVPRDQLWEMEELVVAGSDDGTLDWFVRQFGQDDDGEVYVLVSRRGTPEEQTGAVLQIVPPDEGDGSATADETTVGEGQETVEGEGETTTEAGGGETVEGEGQETVAGEGETATEVGEETTVEGDEDDETAADDEETTVVDDLGIIERDR